MQNGEPQHSQMTASYLYGNVLELCFEPRHSVSKPCLVIPNLPCPVATQTISIIICHLKYFLYLDLRKFSLICNFYNSFVSIYKSQLFLKQSFPTPVPWKGNTCFEAGTPLPCGGVTGRTGQASVAPEKLFRYIICYVQHALSGRSIFRIVFFSPSAFCCIGWWK